MIELYLTRHGRTSWNELGRFQGLTDVPLDAQGRAQALALAEALLRSRDRGRASTHGRVGAVLSSDLLRASETAQLVAERLQVPLLGLDADLRERGYGVFEGLTREECAARYPQAWAARELDRNHEPPGAEPRGQVLARMQRALERAADMLRGRHRQALIIGHGSSLRMFLETLSREPVASLANLEMRLVRHDDAGFRLATELR